MISRAIEKGSGQDGEKAGERLALRQSAVIAAVFLAFHLLLVFWRPNPFWGADLLFYYPAPLWFLYILLAVLILLPGFRRLVQTWICALPFTIWGNDRSSWLTRTVMLLVALAVFFVLRTANHLLGDGYLYLRELDADIWQRFDRAPLTFVLIRALHTLGGSLWVLWETAENTYRIYSCASGLLFVLLCFPVAGAIGKCSSRKIHRPGLSAYGGIRATVLRIRRELSPLRSGHPPLPSCGPARMGRPHPALMFRRFCWECSSPSISFSCVFGPSLLVLAYCRITRKENTTALSKMVSVTLTAIICNPR